MTFSEIKKRFKAETPFFFKKVMALGIILTTIASALMACQYYNFFPLMEQNIAGHMLAIGITMTTIAKLTVKDPKDVL
jgi:hypothetical protein